MWMCWLITGVYARVRGNQLIQLGGDNISDDIWNCIENLSDVGLSIELIISNGLHMVWKTAFHESSFPL